MAESNDPPKIIVDDDWKQQARREKEEAEQQARQAAEQEQAQSGEPSILEILQMLIMQVSVGLGGMQDPGTGQQIQPNLPAAKHFIDLVGVLQEKTKGNLDENEQKVIDGTMRELQMAFVQVVNEYQRAAAEQQPPQPPKQ